MTNYEAPIRISGRKKKQKQFDQIKPIEVVGHAPSNAFTS